MTDYSAMTDEQINEAIAVKRGWIEHWCYVCEHSYWQMPDGGVDHNQQDAPNYTHDWRLAGELLEEMKEAEVYIQWFPPLDLWGCEWIQNSYEMGGSQATTPQRAICEAWLAWKEAD